jgi:putative MATE family efflux protein
MQQRTALSEYWFSESGRTGMKSPARSRAQPSLWSEALRALQRKQHDYTHEPLNRSLVLLAVPMVMEMVMQSLLTVANVFWVSHLGPQAIAVVGLTESVMALIYAVAIGISVTAAATVARRIGENDSERASQSAAQIALLGAAIALALGLTFGHFSAEILAIMGADHQTVELGADFARLMLGGNVTVFMMFVLNAIFRGAGDAVVALRTLWLANGLNMVLDPCLILGWGPFPELGVTGAAVATTVSRGTGVLYQLWHLTRSGGRIQVHWRHWRPDPAILKSAWPIALKGTAQVLVGSTSLLGLLKILASFGSTALAGYTIAVRILAFGLLPALGLASAATTLVGQNLGAAQPDRAESAVRIAMRLNVALLTLVGIAFVTLCSTLVQLFTTEAEVLAHAVRALWIMSLGLPIYAAAMCLAAAFNGAGDTWTPTRISFFCLWLGQVPLAWVLAIVVGLGPSGVFIAVPTSLSVLVLWNYVLFKQGRWKLQKV